MLTRMKIIKIINDLLVADRHMSNCYAPFGPCSCRPFKEIGLETDLIKTGILDSFNIVALILSIEKEFGVKIDDTNNSIENFSSAKKIEDLVAKLRSTK